MGTGPRQAPQDRPRYQPGNSGVEGGYGSSYQARNTWKIARGHAVACGTILNTVRPETRGSERWKVKQTRR